MAGCLEGDPTSNDVASQNSLQHLRQHLRPEEAKKLQLVAIHFSKQQT
jgi:hypothetical protein